MVKTCLSLIQINPLLVKNIAPHPITTEAGLWYHGYRFLFHISEKLLEKTLSFAVYQVMLKLDLSNLDKILKFH